ncbi:LOW QUALITY PROTEIN: mitochondrial adenyl nucleotide antiporter SLC25A24-B-like [Lethenteron reissneri]|uniref:LOW QUALITY PROTEIN: mitochondrial adenyl nucleotide antiporter SLC25A24-B-like n=1 Tax=Lethenteron reissneri TaxID=7753 RepID=UPI002AB732C5|nr:LOW QUALITY PROTEIN: mitochondrial adenyl nucleotide antiporter SLC25A24-B-like [Lethenteron reissneri]
MSTTLQARAEKLFHSLDTDGNGRIDFKELRNGLRTMGMTLLPGDEERLMREADSNGNHQLDYEEFCVFLERRRDKLKAVFSSIDKNVDGKLSVEEIKQAVEQQGLALNPRRAKVLLYKLDRDGSSTIDWDEWLDFYLLHPADSMEQIVQRWTHSMIFNAGDGLIIPQECEDGVTWWRHLLAGGGACAVSYSSTAPLLRLRVEMQVRGTPERPLHMAESVRRMIREGGLRALWRGNGANVVKMLPESAIMQMTYEQLKKYFRGEKQRVSTSDRFAAGCIAGGVSSSIVYPLEVLRTRLTLRTTGQYASMVDCARQVVQAEGWRAFYKGLTPHMVALLPHAGIDLALYETLKELWLQHCETEHTEPGLGAMLACGAVSSTCAQLGSYPLLLIKTRMQAGAVLNGAQGSAQVGMWASLWQLGARGGLLGLYRGIVPTFARVIPSAAVCSAVYDHMKRGLGVTHDAGEQCQCAHDEEDLAR